MTTRKPQGGDALFVYGTLTEPATRERLLGRRVHAIAARLPGYRRGLSRHFYIVRDPDATTDGVLLGGLDERDFLILDEYEDVPRLYTRECVEMLVVGAGAPSAWVYLPTGWAARGVAR